MAKVEGSNPSGPTNFTHQIQTGRGSVAWPSTGDCGSPSSGSNPGLGPPKQNQTKKENPILYEFSQVIRPYKNLYLL